MYIEKTLKKLSYTSLEYFSRRPVQNKSVFLWLEENILTCHKHPMESQEIHFHIHHQKYLSKHGLLDRTTILDTIT